MTTKTLTYTEQLTAISCGACHIAFAIPDDMLEQVKARGTSFWCPQGHKISYRERDYKRHERELREARAERDWARTALTAANDQAQAAEYRRRAAKGQLTKLRNKVSQGKCPCCGRVFAELSEHMETEHPFWGVGDDAGDE